MAKIMTEEHGKYGIDCTNAIWSSEDIHRLYHAGGISFLCDADFVLETEQHILLIEYKNVNTREALLHVETEKQYNPFEEKKFWTLIRKFYDSIPYLYLKGKLLKPIRYICVLEYPKGDSVSRKMLRNKMKKKLPFSLQDEIGKEISLIYSVDVMNIQEWNEDTYFGQFPIKAIPE